MVRVPINRAFTIRGHKGNRSWKTSDVLFGWKADFSSDSENGKGGGLCEGDLVRWKGGGRGGGGVVFGKKGEDARSWPSRGAGDCPLHVDCTMTWDEAWERGKKKKNEKGNTVE